MLRIEQQTNMSKLLKGVLLDEQIQRHVLKLHQKPSPLIPLIRAVDPRLMRQFLLALLS